MNGKTDEPSSRRSAPQKPRRTPRMRLRRLHFYFQRRGYYRFVAQNFWKLGIAIALLFVGLWAFSTYILSLDYVVCTVFPLVSDAAIITIFLISESFLSLLSPDVFILWAKSARDPYAMVALLGVLSYAGGVISYLYGARLYRIPRIQNWLVQKYAKYLIQLRKFGALLVIIAAFTPLPFSPICAIAGLSGYSFRAFLLISLVRILRFFLYAYLLFSLGLITGQC